LAKRAFITGITGQDGSYLAEFLIGKGYEVHGLVRRTSVPNTLRIEPLLAQAQGRLLLHPGDIQDANSLMTLMAGIQPDEVYHLAAQSHVGTAWKEPVYTVDVTGLGMLRVLEAVRCHAPDARVFHPSSSEMFGSVETTPQDENTPFHPRNPYGVAKVYGHWITLNYRESYNLYAVNGILYNHESPRRDEMFVTRKITAAVARIKKGLQAKLVLGNLDARRDVGFAGDYVEAMWLMLQQKNPEDYVIATGQAHSVREFCEEAFARVGLDPRKYVEVDEKLLRPGDTDRLVGNPRKAREKLRWSPRLDFRGLVHLMVDSDLMGLKARGTP
jgi:GDPmannose 4,6-dehydratase